MQDRHILLIICGGISAYKTLDLIRLLRKDGAEVKAVLTSAGAQFVTPLAVSALTGTSVNPDLLDPMAEADFGHIALARWADMIVIAPATADFLATMARGGATDLASTLLLAATCPVVCAPAMNVHMWQKPATQRNLDRIIGDGVHIVGPEEGEMACGDFGPGRMSEPEDIRRFLMGLVADHDTGLTAVVTAGPTQEPIDPVRYLTNRSSGKQGIAIAAALAARGIRTRLVLGPTGITPPVNLATTAVTTASEMHAAVHAALPAHIFVACAAVADWRMADVHVQKMKKSAGTETTSLALVKTPDILASVASLTSDRPRLVVGFAAETENLLENARCKLAGKQCDWIVANDVSAARGTFGGDTNAVVLLTGTSAEEWPRMTKQALADQLARRIHHELSNDQDSHQLDS